MSGDRSEDKAIDLPDCGDAIEETTFMQILEMDDSSDMEFSRELVFAFFEQSANTITEMNKALVHQDVGGLIRLGSQLRGPASTLGLTKVHNLCDQFRHISDERTIEDALRQAQKIFPRLREDCADAERRLRAFYDRHG